MIEIKGLSKSFAYDKKEAKKKKNKTATDPREGEGVFHAVRDVSFQCGKGKVLGLLGPNGAGKTTTLRMLSTALEPTAGEILINGHDVTKEPRYAQKLIGFLSGKTGLYHRLTVRENVEYFGRMHGLSKRLMDERIDKIFSMLDMHTFAGKRADDLSTGMMQRASIARAVIHDPKVLVFDEPTTGLDVISAKTVLDFIESYKETEMSVIFSTHHLHEVERLCDEVCLIDLGETKFYGSTQNFASQTPSGNLYDAFLANVNNKEKEVV
ncbi:ATP-binding cassette domain-containing protein [Kangiella japonica]|uniref:ATP-binding cassette domain-containing protein n=1 Tax=Kangiella japonica TaxID=647384 RepID=A0ABN0SW73_9GAMM